MALAQTQDLPPSVQMGLVFAFSSLKPVLYIRYNALILNDTFAYLQEPQGQQTIITGDNGKNTKEK